MAYYLSALILLSGICLVALALVVCKDREDDMVKKKKQCQENSNYTTVYIWVYSKSKGTLANQIKWVCFIAIYWIKPAYNIMCLTLSVCLVSGSCTRYWTSITCSVVLLSTTNFWESMQVFFCLDSHSYLISASLVLHLFLHSTTLFIAAHWA